MTCDGLPPSTVGDLALGAVVGTCLAAGVLLQRVAPAEGAEMELRG